jgi:hypothetical protein
VPDVYFRVLSHFPLIIVLAWHLLSTDFTFF